MPTTLQAPTYDDLSQWLKIATAGESKQKRAGAKSASEMETSGEGTKDPGGYDGPSSHPSARNASNTQAAPVGARAKENEEDNKEDRGPASVDSTSAEGGGSQDDKQMHVGMNPSATGDDPSVEDNYKGDKEDGETSHPADAADTGEKYSAWDMKRLCKTAEALQNNILANITMGFGFEDAANKKHVKKSAAPVKAGSASPAAQRPQQPTQHTQQPVENGYELAAAMGLSKSAADENVSLFLAGLMKEASEDADRVGACLAEYYQKRSEGSPEMENSEDHGPSAPEEEGAEGGQIPPEILAAAGGGGEGGAPPPEAGGGGGGGEDIQQLAMALMEAGIPPEQLPALIAAAQGDEGGGGDAGALPPPEAGGGLGAPGGMGGPPGGGMMPPGPDEMGAKIASAVMTYQRSGKFRYTEAKTAEQRRKRDAMKNYILEIAGQR